MYWFLNEGENVDSIQFNTLEEYRDWQQKNHTEKMGAHFK
jgi:hypothetical protein